MSSRYQINRLWDGIAPILTTNLIEAGVIGAAANEQLTLAAVTSFDRYTKSSLTSPAAAAAQDIDSSSSTNKRRRRRRQSFQDEQSSADIFTQTTKSSAAVPTLNDNFFEYQRRMGYTLNNNQSDDDPLCQQLKETHIIDAIIFYLQHFHVDNDNLPSQQRLASSIVHELQSDSPGITIDLWATVQRVEGSHHKYHVHEAVVSGVYYSNCPLGCAPLVLRRPLLDCGNNLDYNAQNIDDGVVERDDDKEIHPRNGQLVLFPPWLQHGVPLAKGPQQCDESSNLLPRVSWAFNLNARLAYVGNAWDVTRPLVR